MQFDLIVPEGKLKHLNVQAHERLQGALSQYADDLLAEAGRLEANMNAGSGTPQITSAMVRDAELLLRRGLTRPAQHWSLRLLKIVSTASAVITGLMADKDYLANQTHLVYFVIALTVTVASTVIVLMKE